MRPIDPRYESRADAIARGIATGAFLFPGAWFATLFVAARLGLMNDASSLVVSCFAWIVGLAACSRVYQQNLRHGATVFATAFLATSILFSLLTLLLFPSSV